MLNSCRRCPCESGFPHTLVCELSIIVSGLQQQRSQCPRCVAHRALGLESRWPPVWRVAALFDGGNRCFEDGAGDHLHQTYLLTLPLTQDFIRSHSHFPIGLRLNPLQMQLARSRRVPWLQSFILLSFYSA